MLITGPGRENVLLKIPKDSRLVSLVQDVTTAPHYLRVLLLMHLRRWCSSGLKCISTVRLDCPRLDFFHGTLTSWPHPGCSVELVLGWTRRLPWLRALPVSCRIVSRLVPDRSALTPHG